MATKIFLQKPWFVLTATICLFLTVAPIPSDAQTTRYWIGGDGNWTDNTKWSGGTAPVDGDKAILSSDGNVTYNLNLSLSGLEITPTGTVVMRLSHASGSLTVSGTNSLIVNGASYDECDIDGTCTTRSYARYVLYDGGILTTTGNSIIATNNTGEFYHIDGTKIVGQDLILGRDSGSYGYYQMEGGTLNVAGNTILGQTGWGHFYQDAGTHNVGNDLILANSANLANEESVGYYELWGGSLNVAGNTIIGASGYSGWFDQYDGAHDVSTNLILGRDAGSWGRYDLMGGTLNVAGSSIIGQRGEGVFVQTAGSNHVSSLYLGYNSTGNGTYELSDLGYLSAEIEIIGLYGTGTFTQTGGTNTTESTLYLGYYSGSNGTFKQTGGTNTVTNNLLLGILSGGFGAYELSDSGSLSASNEYIGYYGTGTFKQAGGINTVTKDLYVAYLTASNGTYELSATGSLSANAEYIGLHGNGIFTQTGGTNTVKNTLYLGYYSGSNGTFKQTGGTNTVTNNLLLGILSGGFGAYELSDSGSLSASNEYIGYYGTGTFKQAGGLNTVTKDLYVAYLTASNGTYELSATGSLSAKSEIIGTFGSGIFNQSGGTNTVTSILTISNTPGTSTGIYNLSGGTLTAGSIVNNDKFNYAGGNLNANITNSVTGTFNLSGAGTRTVNGDVTNYGIFKTTDTVATYTGTFDNYGGYVSEPSSNYFNNLYIEATGFLVGSDGDLFSIAGNFLNYSTSGLWNTDGADLAFTTDVIHNFYLGEAGQSYYWNDLTLYGILHLTGDAYLYANELVGLDLDNLTFLGNGRIYFDLLNANNAYLLSYTSGYNYLAANYDAIPEPATIVLVFLGILALKGIKSKVRLNT